MEEIELNAVLNTIQADLAAFLAQPRQTPEEQARRMVSEFDALARQSGGSAEFVSVVGRIVNYKLSLPPDVAAAFLDEWRLLDAPPRAS